MSEREKFEDLFAEICRHPLPFGIKPIAEKFWQACAELKNLRIAELEEQIRVAKDWADHNAQQAIDLVCENVALMAKFAELGKQEPVGKVVVIGSMHGELHLGASFGGNSYSKVKDGDKLYAAPVIPDLERKLLEARIDEMTFFDESRNYKISPEADVACRIWELRTKLAALNKGDNNES